jgi:hypothetical protein
MAGSKRRRVPAVLSGAVAALLLAACQGAGTPPPQPVSAGPPPIPDSQPAVDAPLFLGQNAFANPIADQADYAPLIATTRADGGNSGVVDVAGPLGRAPVTGSAAVPLRAPLLWGRRGLTTGCQVGEGSASQPCLAAVDASTLTVTARWQPGGQDLNLATAVIDDTDRILVTTRQRHLFVLTRPDGTGSTFRVLRDIDLSSHLDPGDGLLAGVADSSGNLWFVSGGPAPAAGQAPPTSTTVGYVTPEDQVATVTLAGQRVETGLAVDQGNVYLATAPAGAPAGLRALGFVYDLVANGGVQTVWREGYDAGSGVKPGATTRGTGAPVVLLGSQYLAVTDNADPQSHLLVFLRGPLAATPGRSGGATTTSPTTAGVASTATVSTGALSTAAPSTAAVSTAAPSTAAVSTGAVSTGAVSSGAGTTSPTAAASPVVGSASGTVAGGTSRLVCSVPLFAAGASAVTEAPIGYSSSDGNSVIVANGYNTPAPLASPTDGGPANDINQMASGVTRVDVLPDGSGCRTQWTSTVRLETGPILSSPTGLVYGYTEDEIRAATGSYVWYFVALDFRTGRVVWRQRAGAGATKNANREPTMVGANGVLYQAVPLGLVWMRDVSQRP